MISGTLIIAALAALAAASMAHRSLKRFSFTFWVFTFVAASMFYPSAFGAWFGIDLKIFIVPLVQVITFGMGTTLSARDFGRVFTMPWPVFIGIFFQFTVMPFVGLGIATLFGFEPEIAAGIVLIGSVSGGVASNLMAYLAGANVALSVTMTACSTLISPIMTPFWMKALAGRFVPVDFMAMMLSIINMIIVPVAAGLVANRILYSQKGWARKWSVLLWIFAGGLSIALVCGFLGMNFLGPIAPMRSGLVLGFSLIALVALAKFLVRNVFRGPADWMDKALPVVSMAGICIIIAIITARSRSDLLTSGFLLIFAGVIHNAVGYTLGYWGARVFRLSEKDCRTVSLEVGMQNGGMATAIAMEVLKSAKAALAPAIFGPWMNISGSVLASWWRRRPTGN